MGETNKHLVRLQQLLNAHMKTERDELLRYATIVSHDLRLKEYMFIITDIGGDSKPLQQLFDRQFGWLPIDRKIIIDNEGHLLIGENHTDMAVTVREKALEKSSSVFYFQGKSGLEVVAVKPIKYRDKVLGKVAVSHYLSQEWLNSNKKILGGEFFLVENNNIVNSTLSSIGSTRFNISNNLLNINNTPYRLYQITLPGKNNKTLQLWFGLSEESIRARLTQHQDFILILAGAGIIGILIVGLVIIRNFTQPLFHLMHATSEVSKGKIPLLGKLKVRNEFDELSNHFADMLQALREKQIEIDKTHAELEHSAITDTLTGCYNRRHLLEIFPKLLAQAKREKFYVYALMFDLDYFKKINDAFGHIAGDQCLVHFAHLLIENIRTSDYAFRLGGEEFLILMVSEDIVTASKLADKLRQITEKNPIRSGDQLINITVSGGISYANPKNSAEKTLNQMLSRADIALYQAKRDGRNQICISSHPDDTIELTTPQANTS
ncbi:MAG: diguanylate cyclase [Gammaproteobacteria bacterium]|nr:diguanylate cyclase [Gammaproteobacteria bacterium]